MPATWTVNSVKSGHNPDSGARWTITDSTVKVSFSADQQNASEARAAIAYVNTAGDGYGAHATTMGAIANKIPALPPLKKSCDHCRARPDQNGDGLPGCAACKVAHYCGVECQTAHWKMHKQLCKFLVRQAKNDSDNAARALRCGQSFVSVKTLREWYYNNIDIVKYAVVQSLELYKGKADSLWRTHFAWFHVIPQKDDQRPCLLTADELQFVDAESFPMELGCEKGPDGVSHLMQWFGAEERIIIVIQAELDHECTCGHHLSPLFEDLALPEEGEWASMERDEMWRMHIRMRQQARDIVAGNI
ncbi:MYND-type domain-containing protein [Mycena indigotica]|uniref:MYND-type domain-containing protein n=1 Tax=Mycena indigotica TaxID=2126181 RepID=A0A8H6VVR0_9AGAR|nr:MYND-type domain-containing protein [Mycena indigotica]KAF7295667.1 MYND-type domain-containing protein [Mycena indigotica]